MTILEYLRIFRRNNKLLYHMKKYIFLALTFFIGLQISEAQVKWDADALHTNVRFSISHLGISFIDGEFQKISGAVVSKTDSDFADAEFDFTIEVQSIDTRVKQRDDHLRSDDFFNAEKYPNITLKNARLKKSDGDNYTLTGDLTMRDVTKKVTFDVVVHGVITDPWGNTRAGLTATTKVKRKDFNINYNGKLPSGVDEVGNEVKIEVNTELVKVAK